MALIIVCVCVCECVVVASLVYEVEVEGEVPRHPSLISQLDRIGPVLSSIKLTITPRSLNLNRSMGWWCRIYSVTGWVHCFGWLINV